MTESLKYFIVYELRVNGSPPDPGPELGAAGRGEGALREGYGKGVIMDAFR